MSAHIAILDIGKTNKKILVFDQDYQVVYEQMDELNETIDEDGFPCEDLGLLISWIMDNVSAILKDPAYAIKAINFSAYGASFVFIDEAGQPIPPLYNYLKPLDQKIKDDFFNTYGGETNMALATSSPSLGLLNSGLQLFRLKYQLESKYNKINIALHLPQFCTYLLTHIPCSEITSIGCHTMLWDYSKMDYHNWVYREQIDQKYPGLKPATEVISIEFENKKLCVGTGLHDSSAALIPYLIRQGDPFILLSTGTWCIALNPFNDTTLTTYELSQDCLCYITYEKKPVKASRLFLGHEYEEQVHRLSGHFSLDEKYFQGLSFDPSYKLYYDLASDGSHLGSQGLWRSGFENRSLSDFNDASAAYHIMIYDLVRLQKNAINLIREPSIKELYVDGGFSKNEIFMKMLSLEFPEIKVASAIVSQASALGAALVIHQHWNPGSLPDQPVEFKYYEKVV
ncbi:MAG: FGGY family carbohydrate kinase [Saprospiraceae bacterium]